MVNSITNFLAKSTGPAKLRSALHTKTRHMSLILMDVNSIRALQTKIPEGVLGGDIFALISGRIREQLQYSEQTESIADKVQTKRSGFADKLNAGTNLEEAKFALSPMLADRPTGPFALLQPTVQDQGQSFSTPSMANETTTKGQSDPQQISNIEKPLSGSDAIAYNIDLPSLSKKDVITDGRITSKQTITPIFVERLREYWHLNQSGHTSGENPNLHDPETMDVKGDKAFSPALLPNAHSSRSWPEMIGRQLDHKLRPFVSGKESPASSGNIQKSTQSELPEKVEIQNVFNIEVKPEGNGNTGPNTELSEKITDILREQALQHGIDIT